MPVIFTFTWPFACIMPPDGVGTAGCGRIINTLHCTCLTAPCLYHAFVAHACSTVSAACTCAHSCTNHGISFTLHFICTRTLHTDYCMLQQDQCIVADIAFRCMLALRMDPTCLLDAAADAEGEESCTDATSLALLMCVLVRSCCVSYASSWFSISIHRDEHAGRVAPAIESLLELQFGMPMDVTCFGNTLACEYCAAILLGQSFVKVQTFKFTEQGNHCRRTSWRQPHPSEWYLGRMYASSVSHGESTASCVIEQNEPRCAPMSLDTHSRSYRFRCIYIFALTSGTTASCPVGHGPTCRCRLHSHAD